MRSCSSQFCSNPYDRHKYTYIVHIYTLKHKTYYTRDVWGRRATCDACDTHARPSLARRCRRCRYTCLCCSHVLILYAHVRPVDSRTKHLFNAQMNTAEERAPVRYNSTESPRGRKERLTVRWHSGRNFVHIHHMYRIYIRKTVPYIIYA